MRPALAPRTPLGEAAAPTEVKIRIETRSWIVPKAWYMQPVPPVITMNEYHYLPRVDETWRPHAENMYRQMIHALLSAGDLTRQRVIIVSFGMDAGAPPPTILIGYDSSSYGQGIETYHDEVDGNHGVPKYVTRAKDPARATSRALAEAPRRYPSGGLAIERDSRPAIARSTILRRPPCESGRESPYALAP